jgi:hypothetical protein
MEADANGEDECEDENGHEDVQGERGVIGPCGSDVNIDDGTWKCRAPRGPVCGEGEGGMVEAERGTKQHESNGDGGSNDQSGVIEGRGCTFVWVSLPGRPRGRSLRPPCVHLAIN